MRITVNISYGSIHLIIADSSRQALMINDDIDVIIQCGKIS
jgi:hypothetical protein